MTKRDELLALAERCEKASEGSRELDAAIHRLLHPEVQVFGDYVIDSLGFGRAIPSFTTSLDAAMTLVPANHDWSLFFDNGAAMAGCMPASEDGCDWTDVPGATPALAICAAALRAQAEMEG